MESLIEFASSFNSFTRENALIIAGIFFIASIGLGVLGKKQPRFVSAVNRLPLVLSYGYILLWAACLIVLGQYEKLVAPVVVMVLPLISLLVTRAYRRYDVWIDKVAERPDKDDN